MNRLELNRKAFYLRILVQIAVLAYIMSDVANMAITLYIGLVMVLILIFNTKQMNLPDDALSPRYMYLVAEWLVLLSLFPFVPYSPYFILMIVLVVTVVSTTEDLYFQVFFVFIFGMTPVAHSKYMNVFTWNQLISFILLLLFFISYSYFYRKFEEQQWKLEKQNESLQGYAQKEKEWALDQERNRIARDIHDNVAHQSTGLIIQLQKMQKAYELGRDSEITKSMRESEQVARSMLNNMRQSVRMISPVEVSESPFEQLFADYSHLTDMSVRHKGIGHLYGLSLGHQADIYAICQEALTNAKRHGNASVIDINVSRTEDHYVITIKDNGTGVGKHWQKGFGLTNMEERVKAADGQWELSNDNGTTITITWPV